jgi:dephospho-CoA kinase
MIVGLTGLSGSGKNFIADRLKKTYGGDVFIIDCDAISHEVLNYLALEIGKTFGMDTYLGPNLVSRRVLSSLVFKNPQKLKKLEDIQFPEIEKRVKRLIEDNKSDYPLIVLNAPTLNKSKLSDLCDFILVTTAPFWIRFLIIKKRDKRSFIEIIRRFAHLKISTEDFSQPQYFLNTFTSIRNIDQQLKFLCKDWL